MWDQGQQGTGRGWKMPEYQKLGECSHVESRSGKQRWIPWCPPSWKTTRNIAIAVLGCVSPQGDKSDWKSGPTGEPEDGGWQGQKDSHQDKHWEHKFQHGKALPYPPPPRLPHRWHVTEEGYIQDGKESFPAGTNETGQVWCSLSLVSMRGRIQNG